MRALIACALVALALALALGASPARAADRWQDLPPSLQLEAVGDSLRMNGTPMTIRAFRSRESAETLLREVQAAWERDPGKQPVRRASIPNWTVLNQTIGDRHRSFQVRERNGIADGFVAVTSPREAREPQLALRMPALVLPMQVIDSVDQGKVSQQVLAVSRRSVEATAHALDEALKSQRWERRPIMKRGPVARLSANRGAEQFDAFVSAQKSGSLVMINTVK
ncbi:MULTISPECIES: hypothetical protein [Massilia]|uniref:Uncharacterized protein n=1 Tax=Massilia haematophila TaxID=457923 RepID=A0ABV7PIH6_9BURK|nr:hypothetical protein [Massilia sp.]